MDLSNNTIARAVNSRLRLIRRLPRIDNFFEELSSLKCDWGIAGGFVRDALFDREAKDVDVLVDCEPALLESTFKGLRNARKKNEFGGWNFQIDGVPFDLWTVKESWRIQQGKVKYEGLESFLECISLNIDSIIVSPDTSRVYEKGFKECLNQGRLEFHFYEHLYPKWIARKALEKAGKYNLILSPEAKNFVRGQLSG